MTLQQDSSLCLNTLHACQNDTAESPSVFLPTICAWCLSEQGLLAGEGSHGICKKHADAFLLQWRERHIGRHRRTSGINHGWEFRVIIGWLFVSLLVFVLLLLAAVIINEQFLRHRRISYHNELPLDGQGRPLYIPQDMKQYQTGGNYD